MNENDTTAINILHVLGSLEIGGAETLVLNILRTMKRNHFNNNILVHRRVNNGYEEEISTMGCAIYNMNTIKELGIIKFIISLVEVLRNNNFDIIHIHTDYQSGVIAFAAFIAGIRIRIIHSHSGNWGRNGGIKLKVTLFLLRLLIAVFGNKYIACSKEAGDFLFPWIRKSKILYLKNGIDTGKIFRYEENDRSILRETFGIKDNTLVIGHIGRFVEVKNHKFIVHLAQKFKTSFDGNFKFMLVGEGPIKNEIIEFVENGNLNENVSFLKPTKNITQYLNIFDCFILPSFYEGLPITIIEAQAVGIPCIVSSSVTRECDLNLGLVEFLDIDRDNDKWSTAIVKTKNMEFPGKERIKILLKTEGFDIRHTTEILENMYQDGKEFNISNS